MTIPAAKPFPSQTCAGADAVRPARGRQRYRAALGQLGRAKSGFTLIELIVVMALLATVLAVAAPSLSRFFRSRTLDSEACRFVALTRYAQSRAVSEGVPMLLWIDCEAGRYGLVAESVFVNEDDKAIEFALAENLEIEVESQSLIPPQPRGLTALSRMGGQLQIIRFTPDGFIDESSPERIAIRQGDDAIVWIGLSRTRLNYEVQTEGQVPVRR